MQIARRGRRLPLTRFRLRVTVTGGAESRVEIGDKRSIMPNDTENFGKEHRQESNGSKVDSIIGWQRSSSNCSFNTSIIR